MKRLIIFILCLVAANSLHAQIMGDAAPTTIFYENGVLMNANRTVVSDYQAQSIFTQTQYDEFTRANRRIKTGSILNGVAGAFIGYAIGYPLGYMIGGGDVSEVLGRSAIVAACGLPFLAVGIPLSVSGKNKLKSIASEYNALHRTQASVPTVSLGATSNGFGLTLSF